MGPPSSHPLTFAFLRVPQASELRLGKMTQECCGWLHRWQRERELERKKEGRPAVLFLSSSPPAFSRQD